MSEAKEETKGSPIQTEETKTETVEETKTGEKRKNTDTSKSSKKKKVEKVKNQIWTFKSGAEYILEEEGTALSAKEITKRILDRGMVKTEGKTPDATVASQLSQDYRNKGAKSTFIALGGSIFALRAWGNVHDPETYKNPPKIGKIGKRGSEKEKKVKKEKSDKSEKTEKVSKKKEKGKEEKTVKKSTVKTSDSSRQTPSAGNQDYGYLYLRYVLDLNRRLNHQIETPEDDCLICKNGGDLICCDYPNCPKVYHEQCLKLSETSSGEFFCPKHFCIDCDKNEPNAQYTCLTCTTSYCQKHLPSNTRKYKTQNQIICKDCLPLFEKEIE